MDSIPRRSPDFTLFGAVLALISLGVVMIYSASGVVALDQFGDGAFFLKRQVLWALLGLGGIFLALTIRYERLRQITPLLVVVTTVALAAVLIPGIGRVAGGARRWITVGPFNFQPAEAAKLVLLLYLANYVSNRGPAMRELRALIPPLALTGVWFALIMGQPDMGSAAILLAVAAMMLFLGGASVLHLTGLAAAAVPPLAAITVLEPYRVRRLLAFLNPWADPQGGGFHIIQSLLALGSGGLLGAGLGQSRQKFFYLPERHTDFIFAILGEELGLAGTLAVILLFAVVAFRGLRAARAAPTRYGALLAAGITGAILGQAMLNIGVASGLLPITGVPLPFLSFGGSSLLFTCLGTGILLNISQHGHRTSTQGAPGLRPARGTLP